MRTIRGRESKKDGAKPAIIFTTPALRATPPSKGGECAQPQDISRREAVVWGLLWDERRRRERVLRGYALRGFLSSFSALAIALALKAFYSRAGATELLWILAPSAWLARFAGGIDLVYEQGAGYITHAHHLVVGPACAGVNFLIIAFLCLFFSFKRHFPNKLRWLLESLATAYVATIAANGLRIFVSAYLWDATIYRDWVTPEQMHRLAGTVTYYASLLGLYFAMDARFGARTPATAPLLWYIGISLGVPLAGSIFAQGAPGFAAHAAWVIAITLVLTAVKFLPSVLRNRIHLSP